MVAEEKPCRFCRPFDDDVVVKNELCYARWDRFPVGKATC